MRRSVPGVLAVFEERELMLAAVRRARSDGLLRLTAYAPTYDCELVEMASPAPLIGIGPLVAGAGLVGLLAGFGATVWMTVQWPLLRLGGKPLVAVPPFLVIGFEMLILVSAVAVMGLLVLYARSERPREGAPYDPRFSDGFYGLWIECPASRIPAVADTMQRLGAIECRLV
jgi:hypothetical protein